VIDYLDLSRATAELRVEIDEAVAQVLDSGRYIGGAAVEAFETDFAAYCGARHAVGVGNGLDALTLTLRALGTGEGDEVIVPSNTYIATWLAISATGACPVPVEPSITTYNLDPDRVEAALTSRTKAILAVHLYGRRADMAVLGWIAERHGLPLITDSAQAHGIPCDGYTAAFSFYPTKNLGALGDGGAVVTDDAKLAGRIRALANYGSRQKYHHEVRGVNSRLDPLQAAVLSVKLRHLDSWNMRRSVVARQYLQGLGGVPDLSLPGTPPGDDSARSNHLENVWHIFAVRHPQRDDLARQLRQAGVETMVHYPVPPHLSEAYRDLGFRRGDFPLAEAIADTELSLPLHPHLRTDEVEQVISSASLAACLPAGSGGR